MTFTFNNNILIHTTLNLVCIKLHYLRETSVIKLNWFTGNMTSSDQIYLGGFTFSHSLLLPFETGAII